MQVTESSLGGGGGGGDLGALARALSRSQQQLFLQNQLAAHQALQQFVLFQPGAAGGGSQAQFFLHTQVSELRPRHARKTVKAVPSVGTQRR